MDGLSIGTIWALIALGYTLVYGIIELINFAHGDVFMIGSFVSVSMFATLGMTATGALRADPRAALTCSRDGRIGTLNVMIERVAYRPLRDSPKLAPLITAIGISFILQNVGLLWRAASDRGRRTSSAPSRSCSRSRACPSRTATCSPSRVTTPLVIVLVNFIGAAASARPCAPPRRTLRPRA